MRTHPFFIVFAIALATLAPLSASAAMTLFTGSPSDYVGQYYTTLSNDMAAYQSQVYVQASYNTWPLPAASNFVAAGDNNTFFYDRVANSGTRQANLSASTVSRLCSLIDPTATAAVQTADTNWTGTSGKGKLYAYTPTAVGYLPAGWNAQDPNNNDGCSSNGDACHYGLNQFTCSTSAPPGQTLSISPSSITLGQSATLTWTDTPTRDYYSAQDPGIGTNSKAYGEPDPAQVVGATPINGNIEDPSSDLPVPTTTNATAAPNAVCTASTSYNGSSTVPQGGLWTNEASAGGYWSTQTIRQRVYRSGEWFMRIYTAYTWNTASASTPAESKNGNQTVKPSQAGTYTYTYTCKGANGTTVKSATLTVNAATAASCTATTIANCSLPATASGGTAGSCAPSYPGTCSYTCSNGTWSKSSNTCTAEPDLTVTTGVTPTTATAGTAVKFSATVKNQGNVATSGSFPVLYQKATSSAGASASNIGTEASAASLAANASETSTMDTGVSLTAGTWYVRACANTTNNSTFSVTESNYGNNCGAWTAVTVNPVPVNGACGTANSRTYAYGSTSYSPYTQCSAGSPSTTAFPAAGKTQSWTCSAVTSNGSASPTCSASQAAPAGCTLPWGGVIASGQSVTAYQSPSVVSPATCSSQTRTCNNGTLSGSYTNKTCTVSPQPCSAATINDCILPATASGSSAGSCDSATTGTCNYSCSDGTWTKTTNACVPKAPDLTAGATTVGSTRYTGQPVSFAATASNIGTGPAGSFPNIFQVANQAITATVAMVNGGTVSSLAVNGSAPISGSYTFSSTGTYNVRACANTNTSWGHPLAESNTNNDCGAWQSFTVSYAPCGNGAANPPSCSQCPNNLAYQGGSCVACSNGGCTGPIPGCSTPSNPTCSLTCNNGATNPASCSTFPPSCSVLTATPSDILTGNPVTLTWSCQNASSCTQISNSDGFTTGNKTNSSDTTNKLQNAGTFTYGMTCSGKTFYFPPVTVHAPTCTLSASPDRVAANGTVSLLVSATDVKSCTVTAPGYSKTIPVSSGSCSSTFASPAITSQTTFTLTCTTVGQPKTDTAIVNLLPGFGEF